MEGDERVLHDFLRGCDIADEQHGEAHERPVVRAVERGNGHVGIPPDGHRPERPVGHEGLGGHINGTLGIRGGLRSCGSGSLGGMTQSCPRQADYWANSQLPAVASFAHIPYRRGSPFAVGDWLPIYDAHRDRVPPW
nr:hypothetical protein GCM10020093_105940 [Planobispora longispora]